MNIEIRDAKIEDVEIVAWTVLTALDMETDEMKKFIDSCSDESTMYSWKNSIVALVDGVAVGSLIAYDGRRYQQLRHRTWDSLWDDMDKDYLSKVEAEARDGEFYLDSMAIRPEYRGMGIGRMLIEYAIEKGKRLGCTYSSLLVDKNKPKLEAYYQTMGFERFGEMEFFGHDYYRMRYVK